MSVGFHAQLSARIAVDNAETKRTSSASRPPVTSPSPRPAAAKKIASCAPPQIHRLAPQRTPPPAQGDTGQRLSGLAPDKSTHSDSPTFRLPMTQTRGVHVVYLVVSHVIAPGADLYADIECKQSMCVLRCLQAYHDVTRRTGTRLKRRRVATLCPVL
ncbi:hypothetical protein TNCV_4574041 [Trichonephila clavipes]|nr:hypothetical protein TNCV_4574041 [Trichonephila clavipes]